MPYDDNGNWSQDPEPSIDAGAVVTQMYEAILGRAPDAGGYQAFVDAINSGVPISQLTQSMANSQEAQNHIASGQGPSQEQIQNVVQQASSDPGTFVQQASTNQANKDYVTALYQAVLGRAPDAQGLQDNLNALANGSITPQQLAQSFASSPEAGSNKIPAAQEKQMAQSLAESYGKPESHSIDTRSGDWSGVTPTQLVKAGITNPAILKAAAEGNLNDNIFGAYKVDANQVANALNSGSSVPTDVAKTVNDATTNSFTPNGKVIGTKMANAQGTQAVYYFSDGSTALVNKDGSIDHITPPVSNYKQQAGSMAYADNPGYTMFNGQLVKVETPTLQWDPSVGKVAQSDSGIPKVYDPGPQGGGPGPLGWVSGNLANFDKGVSTTVPGGWTTLGLIAASALSAGTLAPMASSLGGAILGSATATGATTLGTALIGSATSALMAGISGGDVGKAALMGAIGGAIGANSIDIANGLVGADTIKTIADATGQTQAQIANLITNSVSSGVSAAAAGKGDIATIIANNLASTAVGNYTGNIMRNLDSDLMSKVAGSVSTIARVGTTAALNNKDPQQAITNSMGQIIGNMVSQNLIQPGINTVKDAIKNDNTTTPAEKTDAQKNAQLVDDGFKQIVQQFAQSTGTNITPEEIDKYIATAGAKDLPQYYPTAQTVTVTQVPDTITDVGLTNPLVKKDTTTPALTPEEIAQQDAEVAAADKAVAAKEAANVAINPNQTQLDKLWQDYTSGLKGNGGTSPTYSLDALQGTNFLNTPGTGTGTSTTAGPGTGAGGTGDGTGGGGTGAGGGSGTGTVTGGPGTTVSGNIKKVTQLPGTIKQTTSTTNTPITGTIPSIFGATDIKDLTPGLTKGSAFKFANEPTFSEQVTPVPQTQPYDYSGQILNAATGGSTNTANTIEDLKAGLVKGTPFSLANQPKFISALTQVPTQNPTDYTQQILNAAQGGLIQGYAAGDSVENPYEIPMLSGKTWRGRQLGNVPHFQGAQFPGYEPKRYADGGDVEEHNPQFYSVGGLNSMENTYVQGEGDGTSDSVPAMLADGEFVIPADVVSKLGNGSNNAGAKVLDGFLSSIRTHAQDHDPKKLPPESKGPLAYLLDAKRKVG
jgi:hypothetical protein